MKNEIITLAKAVGYVIVGVLIANAIERKYLSKSIVAPLEVPTQE
jgi:general stress protein CsbA